MNIGLDATPLLGARTGVGRYVTELLAHLPAELDAGDALVATAFTLRGGRSLGAALPPGVSGRQVPFPARVLQWAWTRRETPPVTLFTGRVDLFHATNFVLPPVGRAAGVVTVHDLSYLRTPGTVTAASLRYRDLVPRSLRRAAVVCVPSATVAGELAEAHPGSADRIVVTPLGVRPEWAATAPATPDSLRGLGIDRDHLVFVGNLEPRKDVATVVAAYRLLHQRAVRDLPQLVLAGPAGWGEELDLSGLPADLVVRVGHLSDPDLRALVAGARALLYPSRYEGFGLPLLEAFACGTPVLASDIPTTREVLAGADDLVQLFPVGDAEALAELIAHPRPESAGSRDRRRQLALGHSWERTARSTLAAYRRASA